MDTIAVLIINVLNIFSFALLGRAILSWFDPAGRWPISRILADVTEPVIAPIRRVVPPVGMIDLSFIVAFLLVRVLQTLLARALLG
jgi:YggT family protein